MKRTGVWQMSGIEPPSGGTVLRKVVSSGDGAESSGTGYEIDRNTSLGKPKPHATEPLLPRASTGTAMGRTPTGQSVLNLVNCILGASVLGYPYIFKEAGLALASCIMLTCVLACRFSFQLMIYSGQLSSKRTFEDLAEQALGKLGRWTVDFCTAAMNLGSMVAYLNILADVLSSVAGTLIPPGAEPSRSTYITGVTLFAALPVGLIVRDHSVVATFSIASVACIVLFAFVVLIVACVPPSAAVAATPLHYWKLDGLLVAFPVMTYSFTAHPYYLGIYNNLAGSSPPKMQKVTDMSMTLAGALYWVVGMSGYIAFRGRTAGDLLRNFGGVSHKGLRGAYERAVKLCYGLSILGSIPLVIMPFYNVLLPLLGLATRAGGGEANNARMKQRLSDDESDDVSPRFQRNPLLGGTLDSRVADGAGSRGMPGSGGGALPRVATLNSRSHAPIDVVDIKLHNDGIHAAHSHGDEEDLPGPYQHALVVAIILGLALFSALWLPNVEFIFGLTGSTASVVISFIMPALIFIRLLDNSSLLQELPVLPQKDDPNGLGTPSKLGSFTDEARMMWTRRRRFAIGLMLFGLVATVACTDAILSAVREEQAVVELTQKLVAHEAVVEEATRATIKAKQAVAAVNTAASFGGHLQAAHVNTSTSIVQLQQAAEALAELGSGEKDVHPAWDIAAALRSRHQQAADNKVLGGVEASLTHVAQDMAATRQAVQTVLDQLNAALLALDKGSPPSTDQAEQPRLAANELSIMLAKALGGQTAADSSKQGESLQQVKVTALTALTALDQSIAILHQVLAGVKRSKQHKSGSHEQRQEVLSAMQAAMRAASSSNLALHLTRDALAATADRETQDLVQIMTQVSEDLNKAKGGSPSTSSSSTGSGSQDNGSTGSGGSSTSSGQDSSGSTGSTDGSGSSQGYVPSGGGGGGGGGMTEQQGSQAGLGGSTDKGSGGGGDAKTDELKKAVQDLKQGTRSNASPSPDNGQLPVVVGGDVAPVQNEQQTSGRGEGGLGGGLGAPAVVVPGGVGNGAAGLAQNASTEVAAVLQEAVDATTDAQQTVIQEMQDTLGKANAKVQERVVGVLKDISEQKASKEAVVARDDAMDGGAGSSQSGGGTPHVDSGIAMTTTLAEIISEQQRQQKGSDSGSGGGSGGTAVQGSDNSSGGNAASVGVAANTGQGSGGGGSEQQVLTVSDTLKSGSTATGGSDNGSNGRGGDITTTTKSQDTDNESQSSLARKFGGG